MSVKPREIDLIVFDIAGTTVRDDDSVNRLFRAALNRAGIDVDPAEVNHVMGLPKPVAIERLLTQTGRWPEPDQVAVIHDDFVHAAREFYRSDPSVGEIEGATELFQILERAGIKVALDTGFSRPIVDVILDRLGWRGQSYLATTICSDEVFRGRPAPDMVQAVMQQLLIRDPRRVVKVGDTPSDLLEGNAAGCGVVVGIVGSTHSRAELARFPHTHLIDSIRGLIPSVLEV